MSYRERPAGVPGVVLWERDTVPGPGRSRILPDGCLDLIWDGRQLSVAGPDPVARWHHSPPGTRYTALRFHQGTGPAMLGLPASDLTGQAPALADLWPAGQARILAGQVAGDPAAALTAWLARAARGQQPDPVGPAVHTLAAHGASVAEMAGRLGLSERQLLRRCLAVFGYGPRRLGRILRLNRALDAARSGQPLAEVAFACGYADQAHLTREVHALSGTTPTGLLDELSGSGLLARTG